MMMMMMKCSTESTLVLLLVLFTVNVRSMNDAPLRRDSTSIQVEYGDIFDCLDINMQPTLQHPLLRNHTIQMVPSSYPIRTGENFASSTNSELKLTTIGCPTGKIPIWRNHMQNYFMTNEMVDLQKKFQYEKYRVNNSETVDYFAAFGAYMKVHGIQGSISVYEPEVNLESDPNDEATYSILLVGSRNETEFISAGWGVAPADGGDNHARFHVGWKVENKICMDHVCPGFVQVSSDVALGSRLTPVSIYGGPQYQINLMLFKDPKTGNWWLAFGENMKPIGYWPKSLFKFLDIGEEIYWGGEVTDAPSTKPSSQMGSGHFASEGYGKAAFVLNAKVVNENNLVVTPNIENLFTVAETPNCYQVGEAKVREGGGFGFFFGGPGGCKS